MVEKKLEDYLRKVLKAGYGKSKIKEQLLKAGYDEQYVEPLLDALEEQFYSKETSRKWHFIGALGLIVAVISIAYLFLSARACTTKDCFREAANVCLASLYYENIEGSKIEYRSENCLLTKQITAFGPKEPQEIKDLLANKKIECHYEKGEFNEEWLDAFGGMKSCSGQLKDAIFSLQQAQISIS